MAKDRTRRAVYVCTISRLDMTLDIFPALAQLRNRNRLALGIGAISTQRPGFEGIVRVANHIRLKNSRLAANVGLLADAICAALFAPNTHRAIYAIGTRRRFARAQKTS